MNTVATVMAELKRMGNPLRVKAFARHAAPENLFGISLTDLKTISKTINGEQQLANSL